MNNNGIMIISEAECFIHRYLYLFLKLNIKMLRNKINGTVSIRNKT